MPDLADGESTEVKGSGSSVYTIRNTGGVYSCSCPAWRNQSIAIERRTCKHIRRLRGDSAETERVGSAASPPATRHVGTESGGAEEGEENASTAPPLLLAHSWDNELDLSGWWMSEKLDGVRAYWDGTGFVSRLGNRYHAPDWFLEKLPDTPLDGELWGGRKLFQRTVSTVRRQDKNDLWKEIAFLVFDAPKIDAPFEERMAFICDTLASRAPKFARAHAHERCRDLDHLRAELARVEGLGGEGLMLRQPGSRYEAGRSTTLLKVKTFHDAEARVVGYVPGAGRHKGRVGALQVEMSDGTRFAVGTGMSDAERDDPPAIGALITYRYQELSDAGVPRFPSFVRVREDGAKDATPPSAKTPRAAKPAEAATTASAPVTSPTTSPATGARRRFEFDEDGSSKFWEVVREGSAFTVTYGRIGSNGQSKTKTCANDDAAAKEAEKLIAEKVRKGYRETGG